MGRKAEEVVGEEGGDVVVEGEDVVEGIKRIKDDKRMLKTMITEMEDFTQNRHCPRITALEDNSAGTVQVKRRNLLIPIIMWPLKISK